MTDDRWEPLERLAGKAPPARGDLADRVLARARTSLRRRRLGAALASAGTVVAVVVGVLAVGNAPAPDESGPVAPTETPSPPPTPTPPGPASAQVQVAVAGIEALVHEMELEPNVLWLSDSLCAGARTAVGIGHGPCARWAPAEQAQLADQIGGAAEVRFVRDAPRHVGPGRPLVRVAALELSSPDRGSVFVFVLTGDRSCQGSTYQVQRTASGWEASPGRRSVIC